MAYSTEAELRNNVSIATVGNISSANVTQRIAVADKVIETDLNNVIDFDEIVVTPDFVNLLSQWKTAELCLVYMYGKKRKVEENSDIDYWQGLYDKLINDILMGVVTLEDGSTPAVSISKGQQAFANTAKDNIEPALGEGKWGDFVTKDELAEDRPTE